MDNAPAPLIKFPWRFVIYGAVALYLIGDLHFCHGPLRRHVESRRNPPPEAVGPLRWVATVNGKPITAGGVDRAVVVYLWKRGKTASDFTGQNLKLVRLAVREELIARRLISTYARLNPVGFDAGAADEEFERFRSRLDPDENDYATRLELQGITETMLREQFADEAHETAWVDAKTASAREVTEAEVRDWFDAHQEDFTIPERVRAAHVFRVTNGLSEDEVKAAGEGLHEAKRRIESGEATFAEVAEEISEDERTKKRGGDLGVISANRLPPGFAKVALGQRVGVLGDPFRSEIGWHLVRVDERLPARPAEFGEVAGEIRAYLESEKRRAVVSALIKERRGFARIQIYPIDES